MSFKIIEKSLNGLGVIEVKNLVNNEYFNIIPSFGGAINQIVLRKKGQHYPIHKSANSLKEYISECLPMYSGAFLAPFPNRVENGRYNFNNFHYQLEKTDHGLPNAIHGFLYKQPFSIVEKNEKEGYVSLVYHFKGAKGYPFNLFFKNTYKLSKNTLTITSFIRNDSSTKIPFGMGWHPYIKTGTPIDELKLKIPGNKMFISDKNYIPLDKTVINKSFSKLDTISDNTMNDCYIIELNNNTLVYDPQKDLEIFIDQQIGKKGYLYTMYYIPPKRDSIAIEPMTAAPNSFNNKQGLIVLNRGETLNLEFKIGIND